MRGGTEPASYRGPEALVVGCAWGVAFASQSLKRNLGRRGVVTPPYGSTTGDAKQRTAGSSAPTDRRGSSSNHPGQRRTAKRLRQRVGEMGRERGRDHPRSVHQRRTIPQSRPLAVTAPFTQGSLGDGGCGLPRRPVGPPRNDNGFLSFRGQCAHWTWESVLFTMDGDPGRRGRRPLRKGGIAAATTQASGAQRSVRARGREGWAGIGAKTIPKGGPPPRLPGQRLAKRKARKEQLVKFSLCPMTEGCSTAQKVRKSQQSPARAHVEAALTEQNGLAPRPAAWEGASRARNCAAKSVFLLAAPPPFSFCRLQKENGGWIAAGHHLPPRPVRGSWVPAGP